VIVLQMKESLRAGPDVQSYGSKLTAT